ncbi:L,D-transpeptidase family protein [Candidatus Falkowbacteria bacterium]|nr:L,D-transpeptidase family protein [Candidatus Falkowbacteria bacterium]
MKKILITIFALILLLPNSLLAAEETAIDKGPSIRILNPLTAEVEKEFFPFEGSTTITGLSVATVNLNTDSYPEIIVGAGAGEKPLVKIFDYKGVFLSQFLAYSEDMTTGIRVSSIMLSSNKPAIITAPIEGGNSQIRVFDSSGKLLFDFFAFDENLLSGATISAGDVNGDGANEIIVGSGYRMAPIVKIYANTGHFLKQFSVIDSKFDSGINVLGSDINNDGKAEILISPQMNFPPEVSIYDFNGNLLNSFLAYNQNFNGGVNLSSADVDNDENIEIITGAGLSGGAHIRFYNYQGINKLDPKFFAYPDFRGGLSVSAADIDKDGQVEIIVAMLNYFNNKNYQAYKTIKIDLSKQKLYAYFRGLLENEFIISTGRWKYPTPEGSFKILSKFLKTDMARDYGPDNPDNYNLPNVPHVMYFYRDYAIHGAYWHWRFGTRVSHGCVNLKLKDAKWLYEWSDMGIPVIIYSSKK